MAFENGVKNIQAAAYNGARTVFKNGAARKFFGPSYFVMALLQNVSELVFEVF